MKVSKMILTKLTRRFRSSKCKLPPSTWIPIVIYIIFITFMLSVTFPNGTKSSSSQKTQTIESGSNESSEEQDIGELNRVFHGDNNLKEVFQEPMELVDNSDATNVIKFAFRKADANSDGFLTIRELAKYINLKVCDHIDTSIKQNPQIFSEIDKLPIDGLVSWNEYHSYFLKNLKLSLDENYISNHDETKHLKLDRKSKEALMRDKARWAEVLASDPASLTLDEFLAFQHPEASTSNLLNLVEDILRHFDNDGDDMLTADEFTNSYSSSADNKKLFLSDNIDERRAEFKKLIDKNNDGKADRAELLQFVDPRNSRYAIQEAATLFNLSDLNKDKKLSLDEMLNKQDLFMTSKFISLVENFHNEF
ncbi:CLUMA_CG004593, isoform A [Clunio marinus]|uniref:CLUMA_CG004593, isoform A n=1 Tax=Clunio marinus TaxID=568069 RepID=A0A1J1HS43_9DIPT|nr:CLUMA_CG004593, isoform A [Clunio marinus]